MTFNPEGFADMKDKYFLLNGRSYPDTVTTGPLQTQTATASIISPSRCPRLSTFQRRKSPVRISDLDVSEYQTLASWGFHAGHRYNAKLLRIRPETTCITKPTRSRWLAGSHST